MPSYVFKAVSEQNKVVTGRIKDATKEGAIKKLRANNMTPISLKEAVDVVINPETTKKRRNICFFIDKILSNIYCNNIFIY